jgi:pyridoxamine 5'-phosphate oxidase
MASTSSPHKPQPAPWRATFLEHIDKMDSPEFVFSSLHPAPKSSPTPYVPRARNCIFRGFWAELPENKHNDAPKNERIYESELPTFTTDVRMNKPFELFSSSSGHAKDEKQSQGSGGGGPVEAVWWVKGDVMHQWRIKGQAFVIANDIEDEGEQSKESSGVRTVKSELGSRMRIVKEQGKESWSWKREVTGHFGNMSPAMRGSFKNPPPGQPVDQPYDTEHLKPGQKVEDLEDEIARTNFRVVVIEPEEVEDLDLSDPINARRQVYRYDDATGQWSHHETWP